MILAVWHIMLELAPWLFVGALVAGALHALVPAAFLERHLTGRWAVMKAALVGVPMPLCSCAVIPVGLGLKQHGASNGAVTAFLISTPQTGVDSIAVSAAMLGWPFAAFKFVSAFVIGLVGGTLTDALVPHEPAAAPAGPACDVRRSSRLHTMLVQSVEMIRSIWRWLAAGIVVSAAITYFLPPDALAGFGAGGGFGAMLLAMAIGMPLYVCAVASVPIAAALVHGGFPPGAALVFLIAGPACNVATMGAVYRSLGRRTFAIYMLTIAVGSLSFGWAFESIIDVAGLHAAAGHSGHGGHDIESWWAVASAVLLLALFAWFAWDDVAAWLKSRPAPATDLLPLGVDAENAALPTVEVAVSGMTCQNCVSKLERLIRNEAGVSAVAVTLEPGRAVVHGAITAGRVRELVSRAGFQAG